MTDEELIDDYYNEIKKCKTFDELTELICESYYNYNTYFLAKDIGLTDEQAEKIADIMITDGAFFTSIIGRLTLGDK